MKKATGMIILILLAIVLITSCSNGNNVVSTADLSEDANSRQGHTDFSDESNYSGSVSPKVAISETLPSDEKAFAILNQLRRDVSVEMKSDKSGETDLGKDNFVESMMSHSTIVLNSIEKDNCSVTITAPDISGLINEAVDSISLDQDLDSAREQLLMFLVELINGDNPPILSRELSLPISKTDEGYSIEYDEAFLDAIFGGFFTYVNKEGNDQ